LLRDRVPQNTDLCGVTSVDVRLDRETRPGEMVRWTRVDRVGGRPGDRRFEARPPANFVVRTACGRPCTRSDMRLRKSAAWCMRGVSGRCSASRPGDERRGLDAAYGWATCTTDAICIHIWTTDHHARVRPVVLHQKCQYSSQLPS
jgi:hypothetical protein